MTAANHHALRLLAPFQGVLQIVDDGDVRAMSQDGNEWQIQVRVDTRNPIWGEMEGDGDATRLMVYGLWSPDAGLVRLPFDPMADVAAAHKLAEGMVAHLPAAMERLPYALADRHELWLLDDEDQPLALLASVRSEDPLPGHVRRHWQASLSSHNARVAHGLLITDMPAYRRCGDEMEKLVARCAGNRPRTRWIDRTQGDNDAMDFPALGVRHHWSTAVEQAVADDWLRWHAPLLLMLPELDTALRDRLEAFAMTQVAAVARYWRTWPEVLDQQRLQAALVAARLKATVQD